MSVTTATTASTASTGTVRTTAHITGRARTRPEGRVTWARGLASGLVAALVVTVVAAAFRAAGASLSLVDGQLPLLSFGQMVLLSTVVGILIARHTSRSTFHRVAVGLTVLSCAPDLAWGASTVDKAGLVLTHLVAATIIVPRLARR